MELPQSTLTRYDEAARYLLLQTEGAFFDWLLPNRRGTLEFRNWGPTQLTLPNVRQRICDGIAFLGDRTRNGVPVAGLLEIQTTPDANMPGRLLLAGGLLWMTMKPSDHPGDRYELLAIVLNLTGVGNARFHHDFGDAGWLLHPVERNFCTLDAQEVMREVAAGLAPRQLLAFIPLMQGGDDSATLRQWRTVVEAEPDMQRRGDLMLAHVFAERVGRQAQWEEMMEGLTFIESPMIGEMLNRERAVAEARGATRGATNAKIESLLVVLQRRFGPLPQDLHAALLACQDTTALDRSLVIALDAGSLPDFRAAVGL